MAKQIIHGIGKAVLRDFKAPSTIIGFSDLTDLSVESTATLEDIVGGNKMFPIASFKTDQALNISGTNATFNPEMSEFLDGATKTTGVKTMTGFMEVAVPTGASIELPKTPLTDSVVVKGFTKGTTTPTAGQFVVAADEITFHATDVGTVVQIVYEYSSSATASEYAVTQKSLAKPFIFDYIFNIYDEDSQVSHEGMIKIYKAQCTSGFSITAAHKGPFAPAFEATARDPQRVDEKLWTLTIDGIEVI